MIDVRIFEILKIIIKSSFVMIITVSSTVIHCFLLFVFNVCHYLIVYQKFKICVLSTSFGRIYITVLIDYLIIFNVDNFI